MQARKVDIVLGVRPALTIVFEFVDIFPQVSRGIGAQRRKFDAEIVRITNGVHDCEAATASVVMKRAQRKNFTTKLKINKKHANQANRTRGAIVVGVIQKHGTSLEL